MAILGTLIKRGIRKGLEQQYTSPRELQRNQLKKLLITARETQFGKKYDLKKTVEAYRYIDTEEFYELFQNSVPTHNYNQMFDAWWHKCKQGESNVTWPGEVKYFALSSGTSEASSKYIPITKGMVKAIRKTSYRQIISLSKYQFSSKFFQTGILMLGGSTHLNFNGNYFEGDLY